MWRVIRANARQVLPGNTDRISDDGRDETPRRFPAPWTAEKIAGGCIVREANGTGARPHLHPRTESDAMRAMVLTEDEARRIAAS
jgi:hypothetical protein